MRIVARLMPLLFLLTASLMASMFSEVPLSASSFDTPLWQQAAPPELSQMVDFHTAGIVGPVAIEFEMLERHRDHGVAWYAVPDFLVRDRQPAAWDILAEFRDQRIGR